MAPRFVNRLKLGTSLLLVVMIVSDGWFWRGDCLQGIWLMHSTGH